MTSLPAARHTVATRSNSAWITCFLVAADRPATMAAATGRNRAIIGAQLHAHTGATCSHFSQGYKSWIAALALGKWVPVCRDFGSFVRISNSMIDISQIQAILISEREAAMRKILEACPSCGGALEIRQVECTVCETQVHARYRPCDFCALADEQSTFLRLFVTSRGNLSEVEKRLGVSYPTVRAKLDEIIEQLSVAEGGAPGPSGSAAPARRRGADAGPAEPPADASTNNSQDSSPLHGPAEQRRQTLAAVQRGEISAADGLERLRSLGARHEQERGTGGDGGTSR